MAAMLAMFAEIEFDIASIVTLFVEMPLEFVLMFLTFL